MPITSKARDLCLGVLFAVTAVPVDAQEQPSFTFVDSGFQRGILPYEASNGNGAGLAAADFDGDGYVDVFVPTVAGTADQLYRNLGNGTFEEVGTERGVGSMAGARCALWFDFDGDADLDLLVVNDDELRESTFVLFRQHTPGFFEDVTEASGLHIALPPRIDELTTPLRGGIVAGDLNNDSYLDLFVTMWNGNSQLLINNGDGSFRDISDSAGVDTALYYAHQPAILDFDGDGMRDIYVAIDFLWNAMYINNGDHTFTDVAAAIGLDNAMNDMGLSLGDVDNDGDFDIYITNIFQPSQYNVLFRNDSLPGEMAFAEVALAAGVDYGGWGWGTTFLDGDNDGWLDIAATNGWSTNPHLSDKSVFYWNTQNPSLAFDNVSAAVNFNDTYWGSGLITFDLERDGDLDLMQTCMPGPLRLLVSEPADLQPAAKYLVVRPRMDGPNHFAVGAIVRIVADELAATRLITAGTSFMSQEPAEAFFGLGAATVVQTVRVEWPDGSVSEHDNIAADQVFMPVHGGPGDLDANGVVDLEDHSLFAGCLGVRRPIARSCRAADIDGDGWVSLRDFARIQPRMGE
ncbi:MAG: FG-GAP-like repeat-containing protein [Planctomycetota bacterium]|jgi:hypothetical protein